MSAEHSSYFFLFCVKLSILVFTVQDTNKSLFLKKQKTDIYFQIKPSAVTSFPKSAKCDKI